MTLVEKYPFASALGFFGSITTWDFKPFLVVLLGFALDKGFNYLQKRLRK